MRKNHSKIVCIKLVHLPYLAYRYVRFIPGSTRLSAEERQVMIGDATIRVQAALQFSFTRNLIYF